MASSAESLSEDGRSDQPEMTSVVFYADNGEFLLLPLAKDAEGWRAEVNQPERLQWGHASVAALGEMVLKCLAVSAVSIGHRPGAVSASMLASGAKSDRAFVKTRHCVYVDVAEGSGCMQVEFWPKNANGMFVGPPDERPDLTVTLPVDASAEAVGAAVIQVLRAGGVDITSQPERASEAPAGNDRVGYVEFRAGLVSDYGLTAVQYDTPAEAIMTLLESVGRTIGGDARLFHCGIMTCSLICLAQGFLPDYLDKPARGLADISGQFSGDDLVAYRQDAAQLRERLAGPYRVVEGELMPDYFPGTWDPESEASQSWWDGLLAGVSPDE